MIYATVLIPLLSILVAGLAQGQAPKPAPPPARGFFYFKTPSDNQKAPSFVAAGDAYRIEWTSKPMNPDTVTLEVRQGAWNDDCDDGCVGKFIVIASNITNEGYFDWVVPENAVPDHYIFKISSTTQFTNQTSQQVKVYQPKEPINGQIFINDATSVSMSVLGALFASALLLIAA